MNFTQSTTSTNNQQRIRWHSYTSLSSLEKDTAQTILLAAQLAINRSGLFRIVLAGGTTPRQVYALLKNMTADWHKWHIYFGDERCLPTDNPDRNSVMATSAWLDYVNIPADQIHAITAELGAEKAAQAYSQLLDDIDQFDLVLLGLGEDGHTASLFPTQVEGIRPDAPAAVAVHNSPKPPADRVSLSARKLSQSRQVLFLVTGEAKRQAVNEWRSGKDIPAANIHPENGVDIYIEKNLL